MIIGKIENYKEYSLNRKLMEALEYLYTIDFRDIQPGKYVIRNDEFFTIISEYETKNEQKVLWEAHKKYIDIHYIIKGSERIGHCKIDKLEVIKEYDSDLDVVLGHAEGDLLVIHEGDFMILFPPDAHKSGISDQFKSKVKKAIVKIRI